MTNMVVAKLDHLMTGGAGVVPSAPEAQRFALPPNGTPLAQLADPAEAELVQRCGAFRTLAQHARRVALSLGAGESAARDIGPVLARLARDGRLIDEPALARLVGAGAPTTDAGASITTIGFVTRDRPRAVARAAVSYATHAREHGHDVRVVVMDDGDGPGVPDALDAVRQDLPSPVYYAGPTEKRAFAARLAALAGVPKDVVAFALLDPFRTGATYGANRNALFLEIAGQGALSADDDTVCTPRRAPIRWPRLALAAGHPATEYRFFETLAEGRRVLPVSDDDVLTEFNKVLGRDVASLIRERPADAVDFEGADRAMIARLVAAPGRVAVAMPGMLGDAGGASPLPALLRARGVSHELMTTAAGAFGTALASRTLLRTPRSMTLSQGGYLMSTAVAWDARDMLPPFFPCFRCEDNLYGHSLRTFRPDAWVAHLPLTLEHDPVEARSYADPGDLTNAGLSVATLVAFVTDPNDTDHVNGLDGYRRVGELTSMTQRAARSLWPVS
jgi:hypothetical protein